MTENPTQRLRFRWPWRPYQARVLETVDRHLSDDRLYIVAAPGAGKTTLGLEVFRRLGRPALVLAPTLTIRDQWIMRLEDFDPLDIEAWTSVDLQSPAFFTAATYQAVLSRSRSDEMAEIDAPSSEEVTTLVSLLREAGVGTLILDEAHHLKRAWWRALQRVVGELDGLKLVSLTGTPPYDATGHEWRRYEELCGPIDDEISVPELVKARTLCPHQDFIFAVEPRSEEVAEVREHDANVDEALRNLLDDPVFHREIDTHPWVREGPHIDRVLDDPEVAVALLAFQRATAAGLPARLLEALDLDGSELPTLSRRWWHVLLKEYLYGDTFAADEEYRRDLTRDFRERGILWRRTLRIVRSAAVERRLGLSGAKVGACVEINRLEREVRREALRQVILTDYIREESLAAAPAGEHPDLGAFPVFDALTRSAHEDDVALITGRLAIIHESRLGRLRDELDAFSEPRSSPLPYRAGWHRIEGIRTGALVAAFTRLLQSANCEYWSAPERCSGRDGMRPS